MNYLVVFLFSIFSIFAQAEDWLVWTDAQGFQNMNTCRTFVSEPLIDTAFGDITDKVIEILEVHDQGFEAPFQVRGSFWSPVISEQGQQYLRCNVEGKPHDYFIFDVFLPGFTQPMAQAAVSPDEMGLFLVSRSYETKEAEQAILSRNTKMRGSSLTADLNAFTGSLNYVVCITSNELNVRDEALSKILFTAKRHDSVLPVQSFGTDRRELIIGGVPYYFINVQFPNKSSLPNRGWVADQYVKLASECKGFSSHDGEQPSMNVSWSFPLKARPTHSYKERPRYFGSPRSSGRKHAACDLYRLKNDSVLSIGAGKIVRDLYYFYQGTYAIEIRHFDGKIGRYGEVTGSRAAGVALGKSVTLGQTIGYVGKVNSGCCNPMLHFEIYKGTASGSLSQSGNAYQRRGDLMDPTPYLTTWETEKFGKSW